jgi:hypothetical protein
MVILNRTSKIKSYLIVSNVGFMAPEMEDTNTTTGTAPDIFSFGILFGIMFVGLLPFKFGCFGDRLTHSYAIPEVLKDLQNQIIR